MYKYYITNMYEGAIQGTNEMSVAYEASMCCDYFVLESETGKWISMGEPVDIKQQRQSDWLQRTPEKPLL